MLPHVKIQRQCYVGHYGIICYTSLHQWFYPSALFQGEQCIIRTVHSHIFMGNLTQYSMQSLSYIYERIIACTLIAASTHHIVTRPCMVGKQMLINVRNCQSKFEVDVKILYILGSERKKNCSDDNFIMIHINGFVFHNMSHICL